MTDWLTINKFATTHLYFCWLLIEVWLDWLIDIKIQNCKISSSTSTSSPWTNYSFFLSVAFFFFLSFFLLPLALLSSFVFLLLLSLLLVVLFFPCFDFLFSTRRVSFWTTGDVLSMAGPLVIVVVVVVVVIASASSVSSPPWPIIIIIDMVLIYLATIWDWNH